MRFVLLALALGIGGCRVAPPKTSGTFADLQPQLDRLVRATDPHAFLVIELEDTPHFVQFSAGADVIELDYPIVTVEQRSREAAVRQFCTTAGHRLRETTGSNGARFLDCDLPRDATLAAAAVRQALEAVFGATATTRLLFGGDRLPAVAA